MIVSVKPVGREEYGLTLDGPPQFSVARFGGYEAATIPCQLSDEERLNVLGARVRIHGVTRIVWQGIVLRRPGRDEPLIAQGWGWCGTLGRRKVQFCDTQFLGDLQDTEGVNAAAFRRNISGGVIKIVQSPATTSTAGDRAGYYYWGDVPLESLSMTVNVAHAKVSFRIYTSDTPGALSTAVYTKTATGVQTGQTADLDGHYGFVIDVYTDEGSTPSRDDTYATCYDLKLYGTAITSPTTSAVIGNILTNEIDSDYLSAVGDFIETETTVIEPLVFDSCDANTKLKEITKYAASDFGWYMEAQTCLPHWTPTSTTPDYVIRVDEAESYDLDESSLDELVSAVVVKYQDVNGKSVTTTVTDTDATHPLVALGITRYGEVDAQTTSAATAAEIGALYLAEKGRAQLKGSVTTRTVYTATGAPAYLPDIRGGQMALVTLPDGPRECIIERVECTGDAIATITLDNTGYRLDVALARLAKRG